MPKWTGPRVLMGVAAGVVLVAIGGFLLAWSGLYNIAASRGHFKITEWFLAFGMRNSVELRTYGIAVPPLDDRDLQALGAAHFHGGCAACHGSPAERNDPVTRHMLPPPPDLRRAASDWTPRELFWIVKHGIKYTGMPAWPAQSRDDEVWAVVAFLERLPQLDAAAYRDLAGLRPPRAGGEHDIGDHGAGTAGICARCHGSASRPPENTLVPILHGQPHSFLRAALQAYADGTRESGIMQAAVAAVADDDLAVIARYYADLPAPPAAASRTDLAAIERGRRLAAQGAAERGIPACLTCHADGALATYPRLAGQHTAYMEGRLRRWKARPVSSGELEAIMVPIAARLTDQDIVDLSAFFAGMKSGAPVGPLTDTNRDLK